MGKFLSKDGADKDGFRAEVSVQTGDGVIIAVTPKGKQNEDGSYRNMEVEFKPNNPLLKRKMYANMDTSSKELYDYVQKCFAEKKDVTYRIESQRKRNVDRHIAFEDLIHTEQAIRILAKVDNVISTEAVTNPAEDPETESPTRRSALDPENAAFSEINGGGVAANKENNIVADPEVILSALSVARKAGLSTTVVDTIIGQALASGVDFEKVMSAGYEGEETSRVHEGISGRTVASEEKPWMALNSDGRINAGSYMVSQAATAEQFALDHLLELYSDGKKTSVDVSDKMISQAASLGLQLLEIADAVQVKATGGRIDRQKYYYTRAITLVVDSVGKRYFAPVGQNEQAVNEWKNKVIAEAAERLYGVMEIAHNRLPKPEAERNNGSSEGSSSAPVVAPVASPLVAPKPAPTPKVNAVKESAPVRAESSGASLAASMLGGTVVSSKASDLMPTENSPIISTVKPSFTVPEKAPHPDDLDFTAPSPELIARVRELCSKAGVMSEPKKISDWLERVLGNRSSKHIHSTVLEAFLNHYEALTPEQVKTEVLS
jgi:hypothetical protein